MKERFSLTLEQEYDTTLDTIFSQDCGIVKDIRDKYGDCLLPVRMTFTIDILEKPSKDSSK